MPNVVVDLRGWAFLGVVKENVVISRVRACAMIKYLHIYLYIGIKKNEHKTNKGTVHLLGLSW